MRTELVVLDFIVFIAFVPAATATVPIFIIFVSTVTVMEAAWKPSSISEEVLESYHGVGLLPSKKAGEWEATKNQEVPTPSEGKIVSFLAFHKRGLALSCTFFFRTLMLHYGVCLHHLNPNGTLQIAIFITLCEAYLRVALGLRL